MQVIFGTLMPFDNYVVGAIGRELNNVLVGVRVERVYQPDREELILCVSRPPQAGRQAGRYNLLISANASRPLIYLAQSREAGPGNPPAFCMLMRKYLVGARILGIAQLPRERILNIEFLTSSELGLKEHRTLVFELMGKHSNIIFLDGARIVDAIKRVSGDMSRVRQTLPGMEYMPPPPGKGISPIMEEEVAGAWPVGAGPVGAGPVGAGSVGAGPSGAGSSSAGPVGTGPVGTGPVGAGPVGGDMPRKDIAYYNGLAEQGEYAPVIYYDGERPADFHVFQLGVYRGLPQRGFSGETAVSEMLEAWYESRDVQGRLHAKSNEVKSALKARLAKLYTKKQRLSEEAAEAGRAEALRETGDLVTANIWRIESGAKRAELEDYLHDGEMRLIELDPRLTPAQNAQRFYKLYGKAKTAAIIKVKQLEECQSAINYLESVAHFLEDARTLQEIECLRAELTQAGYMQMAKGVRKPLASGKKRGGRMLHGGIFAPHEHELASGARLLVGRNNAENDELTLRIAAKTDYWLHTKDIPGSHVILKLGGREPGEADLRCAAEAAAWYSKARGSEGVPVDYVLVRNVKKPSGARPGYVIFTNNKTLYVTPALPVTY